MSAAIVAAFGATVMALPAAQAQQQSGQQLDKVEITGSLIRRVDAETALPVQIIRADELTKQGVTTAEQALRLVASNQSLLGVSQGIGSTTGGQSSANMRGLGSNKTLVLLNGRRIANHAYDSGAADLNAIPLAAIDRIEVLRDGASALYGTDAIGGVINFILRRDFTGVEVSAQLDSVQAAGGDTKRASLVAGFGSLQKQGFNIMASLDYRDQDVVRALDRPFSKSGIAGGNTSGTTFPGRVGSFQPSIANGNNCLPDAAAQAQLPLPGSLSFRSGSSCRYDFPGAIDIIPANDQLSGVLRGTLKLGEHVATLEYVRAESNATNRVAPTPLVGMTIPTTSPFYPAGAPTTTNPGIVTWRAVPAGQRTDDSNNVTQRIVGDISGALAGWDYKAGAWWSKNEVATTFADGYVNRAQVQAGLTSGLINPFGAQSAAGLQALLNSKIRAKVLDASGEASGIDFRASRDLFSMAGGSAALAVGGEFRREKFTYDLQDIAREAASSGLELAQDITGKRDVTALFGEMVFPITRTLEATLSARYDRYSDFGNTFNPKLAVRWQPTKTLLVRASANTGFRAPTLYDIYNPSYYTFTSDAYDDPVLCPGGTAVAGADASTVCGQQVQARRGGPVGYGKPANSLEPEKSRTFSVGIVLEPARNTTVSFDVWDIQLKNSITVLPEQSIFGDTTKYANRILRCSQLTAAVRAVIDVCANFPAFDPIAYIDQPTDNLGEIKTRGVDIGFGWRSGATAYGNWAFSFDGTYVDKYDYQRERGGPFVVNAGRYADSSPILRWRHVASVNWSAGGWGTTLSNRFNSGYTDQDPSNQVGQYSVWDVMLTYTGIRNLTLQGGMKNVLNTEPPYSNQGTTFQVNYDPRLTDPLGRTYVVRAAYKF
jgi:iron complex outermembrane receptor protein